MTLWRFRPLLPTLPTDWRGVVRIMGLWEELCCEYAIESRTFEREYDQVSCRMHIFPSLFSLSTVQGGDTKDTYSDRTKRAVIADGQVRGENRSGIQRLPGAHCGDEMRERDELTDLGKRGSSFSPLHRGIWNGRSM